MGEGGGAIHPAAQIRVWGWKTHSEYGEGGELGSWDRDGAQQRQEISEISEWWHYLGISLWIYDF